MRRRVQADPDAELVAAETAVSAEVELLSYRLRLDSGGDVSHRHVERVLGRIDRLPDARAAVWRAEIESMLKRWG